MLAVAVVLERRGDVLNLAIRASGRPIDVIVDLGSQEEIGCRR